MKNLEGWWARRWSATGLGLLVVLGCGDETSLVGETDDSTTGSSSSDGGGLGSGPGETDSGPEGSSSGTSSGETSGPPDCDADLDCEGMSGPCVRGVCIDRVCEAVPLDAGAVPSSGCEGTMCDGDGACVECIAAADCAADKCQIATCDAGVCGVDLDTSGDCASFTGLLGFDEQIGALAIDPSTGLLDPTRQAEFSVSTFTGHSVEYVALDPVTGDFVGDSLMRFNPEGGAQARASVTRLGLNARTFHPLTGELWAFTNNFELIVFDPTTGDALSAVTPMAPGPKGPVPSAFGDLAFDDLGQLFTLTPHDSPISNARDLYEVDTTTGDVTLRVELPLNARGLIFAPGEGVFYSVAGASSSLYRIDPATETVETVEIPGMPRTLTLAYDPVSDTLYGFAEEGTFGGLSRSFFTIDPAAQSWADARRFGIERASAMAWNIATQRMLVTSDLQLFSVDPDEQIFDFVGEISLPPASGPVTGLTFNWDIEVLYAVAGGNSIDGGYLARVGPTDASTTVLGSLPLGNYGDIAFDPGSGLLFSAYSVNASPLSKTLVTIDPVDLTFASLGNSSVVSGLAYLEESGLLYGLDADRQLASIDPASGTSAATTIGIAGADAFRTAFAVVDGTINSSSLIVGRAARDGRVTFDIETGQATMSGVPVWSQEAAYDPSSDDVLIRHQLVESAFFRFDPATNTSTTQGLDAPPEFSGDVWVDSNGVGYTRTHPAGTLERVDLMTGTTQPIGNVAGISAGAFDDADDFYVSTSDSFAVVDVDTAVLTVIAPLDNPLDELAWDGETQRMLGFSRTSEDSYDYVEVDRTTGDITVITAELPYRSGFKLFARR